MVGTPILLSYMNYLSFLFSVSSKFGFCSSPPTSRAIILPWLLCPLSHQNCMACFAVKFSNSSSSSFSRALCITWYHWPLPPLEALSWLSDQLISWFLPLYGVLSCHSKANTFFLPYIYPSSTPADYYFVLMIPKSLFLATALSGDNMTKWNSL